MLKTPWILAIALFTHTSACESPGDRSLPRPLHSGGKPASCFIIFFFFFPSNKQAQVSTDELKSFFLFYIVCIFTSTSCQKLPVGIVIYSIRSWMSVVNNAEVMGFVLEGNKSDLQSPFWGPYLEGCRDRLYWWVRTLRHEYVHVLTSLPGLAEQCVLCL